MKCTLGLQWCMGFRLPKFYLCHFGGPQKPPCLKTTRYSPKLNGSMPGFCGNARRACFKLAVVSMFVTVHTVWLNKTTLGTLDEFRLGAWEVFFMHVIRVVNRHQNMQCVFPSKCNVQLTHWISSFPSTDVLQSCVSSKRQTNSFQLTSRHTQKHRGHTKRVVAFGMFPVVFADPLTNFMPWDQKST